MELDYLKPLREDDFFVPSFGMDAKGQNQVVPFQAKRRSIASYDYDTVLQGALGGVLAPAGKAAVTGQVTAFQDNKLLGLSASATGINSVTDIFLPQLDYEILEVFWGIAPRYCRVYARQPYNTPVFTLDQNQIPSSTYPDLGYLDGFDSPYLKPSRRSAFYTFGSLSVNFGFYNPMPVPINPRFNFIVNRIFARPVVDLNDAKAVLTRKLAAKWVSIGNAAVPTNFDGKPYGGVKPISPSIAKGADFPTLYRAAGYCP